MRTDTSALLWGGLEDLTLRLVLIATAVLLGSSLLLFGALEAEGRSSLLAGLADPVLGLDHFLALLVVGVWAGRGGDTGQWGLPAAFLIGMLLGLALAIGQPTLPAMEPLVRVLAVVPVFLIALALVARFDLPFREAVSSVALMGGCHGYLHSTHSGDLGSGLGGTTALWFSAGTLASAMVLLGLGVAVGVTSAHHR